MMQFQDDNRSDGKDALVLEMMKFLNPHPRGTSPEKAAEQDIKVAISEAKRGIDVAAEQPQ